MYVFGELNFHPPPPPPTHTQPTMYFDMGADVFFLFEIFFHFTVGVHINGTAILFLAII